MIVRKLRLKRGWSQEQLAALTGLSVRTIQRIERGQAPSLESQNALASVLEVGIETFQHLTPQEHGEKADALFKPSVAMTTNNEKDTVNTTNTDISNEEKYALQYAKSISEFYTHALMFLIFIPVILFTKGLNDPQTWLICGGWSLGLLIHGLVAYEKITLLTPQWERELVEKKLGRKL
ncbi:MAG: helix-turn-helix domain-containing protein [Acidiferrobacterales bacterium]|nr:helix-turn-helix domain-containing protein [Acidiferrobacterales bacterium]